METEDPDRRNDEAWEPLREAGQGESEGFEEAERELIENASHEADSTPDPTHLAGEPEDPRTGAEYGEADHERSQGDEDEPGPPAEEASEEL